MDLKRIICTICLFVVIFVAGVGCSNKGDAAQGIEESEFFDDTNNQSVEEFLKIKTGNQSGNTNANTINNGLACEKDNWVYFCTADGLFRMKNDGTEQENLLKRNDIGKYHIVNINVIDEYIFYLNFVDGVSKEYVLKTDGSKHKVIDYEGKLYITEGDICTWDRPIISSYSSNVDGNTELRINGVSSDYAVNVYKEWIYYCGDDDDGNDAIQRVKIDGTSREILKSGRTDYLVVDGEYIYYQGYRDYYVYRMKLDGSEHEMVLEKPILWSFNAVNGWIYFTDREEKALYKIRNDGTELQKLTSDWAKDINVVGDWIFYLKHSDDSQETANPLDTYCRVKTDGTCYERLGEISSADALTLRPTEYISQGDSGEVHSEKGHGDTKFDFSEFVGEYVPCSYVDVNEQVSNIVLNADGTVTGSRTAYGITTEWTGSIPIGVEENEDGSFTFRIEDDEDSSEFYIISRGSKRSE